MRQLDITITVVAIAMAVYHIVFSQYLLQGPIEHSSTHLGFSLVLVFLSGLKNSSKKHKRLFFLLAAILSLIATGYVEVLHDELEERVWFNTPLDLVIGVITILLVLEATREAFGLIVPLFAVIVVIYPFIGDHLPEPFYATSLSPARTISNLSVGLSGIYGPILSISANYIFLFILFGGLLQATGATRFFLELGKIAGNKLRGGPGLMAITGSAAVGSITGSVAANIAVTGSFTIPLMKKVGYKPEQAAAIEAAASNGGQIMPPIMGIVAFGMAGVTGIPYIKIIAMALLPAILYFLCCGVYVQLRAEQLKIPFTSANFDMKELVLSSPLFIIPITVVIVLLISGYSVMYVAFWAIISTIAVSLIRGKTRPSLSTFVYGLSQGAKTGAQIGVMCAASGLIVSTFVMSGLGVKLSAGIETLSGGSTLAALVIIGATCIILGFGGVALAAYIVVSIFAAPALQKMGISLEQAHFFVMFTTVFAFVTPPVAVAALIASRLAGSDYLETAIESVKVSVAGFLLPFMFIYVPILLLQPQEPIKAIMGILGSIVTLLAIQFAFVGYFLTYCNMAERVLWLVVAALSFTYLPVRIHALFAMGITLFVLLTFWQWRKRNAVRLKKHSHE